MPILAPTPALVVLSVAQTMGVFAAEIGLPLMDTLSNSIAFRLVLKVKAIPITAAARTFLPYMVQVRNAGNLVAANVLPT